MASIADTARIPPELAAFRTALVLGEHATGVEIIDRSLAAVVERAQAQAYVASRPSRPDARDVRDSKVWDNYCQFVRLIEERPMSLKHKHAGKPWDAVTRRGRTQATGGMGNAGRSPQDHPSQRNGKIEW